MANKRLLGKEQEEKAAAFLEAEGYEIISKNYHNRFGEIDLIAKENGILCFVEVKYRSTKSAGMPEEAVNRSKQAKITRVAQYYLLKEIGTMDCDCRFDVVSIYQDQILVYKNAFYAN